MRDLILGAFVIVLAMQGLIELEGLACRYCARQQQPAAAEKAARQAVNAWRELGRQRVNIRRAHG